jgi:hypothetical protein
MSTLQTLLDRVKH